MPWSRPLLIAKCKALLIHVGISAAMFLPLLLIVLLRWFPPPLFFTDGGWQGIRIVAVLDVMLGPFMTFLVYSPAKTRLALSVDFVFIGVVQVAALAFGTYSIALKRIDVIAFDNGAFHAVAHSAFATQNIDADRWDALGPSVPRWVFVREPTAEEALGVLVFNITQRQDRFELQFLYEALSQHKADIAKAALTGEQLASQGGSVKRRFDALVAKAGKPLYAIPLVGTYCTAILVLDENLAMIQTLYPPE
jgi:hypothetical protein